MGLKIDASTVKALTRVLAASVRDVPKEIKQTVISIGRSAKTETKRAAVSVYNTTQARIEQGLRVDTTADAVVIGGKKKPLTLASFKPKAIGRRKKGRKSKGAGQRVGAIFTIIKQSGVKRLARKVFWVGKLPFQRIGDKRFPIAPVPAPSVADMINNESVSVPLVDSIRLRAVKEVTRRIARAING